MNKMTATYKKLKYGLGSLTSVLVFILSLNLQGCGTGVDPLKLFDEPLPVLKPIISSVSGLSATFLTQPYSESNPYWILSTADFQGNFLSPAEGVITGLTSESITIMHSGRLTSKLTGLSSINTRLGDTVVSQQALGVYLGSGTIKFQVYLDGKAVCPLTFLSESFRQAFISFSGQVCI